MKPNPRLQRFHALADHAMLGRDFAKLRKHEIQDAKQRFSDAEERN